MTDIIIQKVNHLDIGTLSSLVDESESEGFNHIKKLVKDYESGINVFDKDGEALFIALLNGDVVGVCGLNQDPYADSKETGRVRRLYVSPSVRRFGVGRMLVESVIAEARQYFHLLTLRTDNPIAERFYRTLGFSIAMDSTNDSHFLRLK